ncbi:substrate-binding domain-containing protein [bacterium]|nr:substrate-binding domain-containing protein [bacterium]
MHTSTRSRIAIVLAALAAFFGCGTREPSSERPRILFLVKTLSNPFFLTMQEGAERGAREAGVELIFIAPQRETDIDAQVGMLLDKLNQGVSAVCIAPAGSRELVPPLLEANRRGIPVFNIDNRLDPATVEKEGLRLVSYIGADNEQGGYLAGRYLAEKLGGQGKVAMLEGIPGVDNAENRKAGFLRAVGEHPGIKVVASQAAMWDQDKGYDAMADILRVYPDLAGLFCANDMMALGAIRAIEQAGRTGSIIVTSYDNLVAAQEAIKAGRIACSIEQHPDLMGYEGVVRAAAYLRGEAVPPELLVNLEVIDKSKLVP